MVDNLPVNLDLARSILEPLGYKVVTADGMAEAWPWPGKQHCDLILSDVCMSGETGYDFIQAVKADPQLGDSLCFHHLHRAGREDPEPRAWHSGRCGFCSRPIEPEALLAEIETCLREQTEVSHGNHPDCR